MKIEDIKTGITYYNKNGLQRSVIRLEMVTVGSFYVVYVRPGKNKEYKCWCTTFAYWAKGIVENQ